MTLRRKTFSAIRWTSMSMVARAVIQFGKIVVLARLLGPADFGMMAMVIAVVSIAQIVSELGVSNAIIHHRDVSAEELSSLFWLNIGVGLAFTLLFAAASPLIAMFYGDAGLTPMLLIAALYFLGTAIGQQQRVMAQKELRFHSLALVEIVSGLVGAAVAITLALNGAGVYALAIGLVTAPVVGSAMAWVMLSGGWRPSLRFRWAEVKRFVEYGRNVIGVGLLSALCMQSDIIVAGRFFGGAPLGFYSVPRELCLRIQLMVNPIITRVGLPVMAMAQADAALIRSIYLKTIRMTTSTNFPVYALLALFAPEVVRILYGAQWAPSADLLRIVAVACLFRSISNPIGSMLYALGRTKLALSNAIFVTLFIFPALWIGAQWGLVGIAVANLCFFAAAAPLFWYFIIRRVCGVDFWTYHSQIAIPLATTAIAGLLGYSAAGFVEGAWPRLIVGGGVGGLAYLVSSYFLNRPWLNAAHELAFPRRVREQAAL
jgi:O-antigen/teichoic acid export membrane protein